MAGYEVLEHTADVGLRVRSEDLAGVFAAAAEGMADIAGVFRPGRGREEVAVALESRDVEGLLVDWLNEVLYQHDARGAALQGVRIDEAGDTTVSGVLLLAPLEAQDEEGVQIKAVTYHQLEVKRSREGWEATVFFDV